MDDRAGLDGMGGAPSAVHSASMNRRLGRRARIMPDLQL